MWAYFGYSHLCTYKHITVNQISPLTFVNTCTLSGLPIYGSPNICMYNNFMINYKKKTLLINKHCILDNFHWKNKCIGSHLFRDSSKCQLMGKTINQMQLFDSVYLETFPFDNRQNKLILWRPSMWDTHLWDIPLRAVHQTGAVSPQLCLYIPVQTAESMQLLPLNTCTISTQYTGCQTD